MPGATSSFYAHAFRFIFLESAKVLRYALKSRPVQWHQLCVSGILPGSVPGGHVAEQLASRAHQHEHPTQERTLGDMIRTAISLLIN